MTTVFSGFSINDLLFIRKKQLDTCEMLTFTTVNKLITQFLQNSYTFIPVFIPVGIKKKTVR